MTEVTQLISDRARIQICVGKKATGLELLHLWWLPTSQDDLSDYSVISHYGNALKKFFFCKYKVTEKYRWSLHKLLIYKLTPLESADFNIPYPPKPELLPPTFKRCRASTVYG